MAYADDITIFVDNEGANLLRKTVLLAHKPGKYNLPFTKKPINNPDVYYLGVPLSIKLKTTLSRIGKLVQETPSWLTYQFYKEPQG